MRTRNSKLKDYYNNIAIDYDQFVKNYISKYIRGDINLFLNKLNRNKILDIGCGSCRDSLYFKNRNFDVTAIDISKKMIEICKKNGVDAIKMNFEKMKFPNQYFDGIWAYISLLHIPKKKLPHLLKKIKKMLKKNGTFFIGMRKGDFEGYKNETFFAHYQEKELFNILSKEFNVFYVSKVKTDEKHIYINFMCKIKN